MLDLSIAYRRFRQFGGMRLVLEYARMGVLWLICKEAAKCLLSGRSLKGVYPKLLAKVEPLLLAKCDQNGDRRELITLNVPSTICDQFSPVPILITPPVWVCWMQGMEQAPEMVKVCYESLRRALLGCEEGASSHAEIILIDASNYRQYVQLPDFIIEKYEQGIIPHVAFTDLLRLELLTRYGGTWIDASVLCTMTDPDAACQDKFGRTLIPSWRSIRESELFFFQYGAHTISTWFISAKKGNLVLQEALSMLYAYWHEFDCLLDYYMIHLFICEAAKRHPSMIAEMPYGNSPTCLELSRHLCEPFDPRKWQRYSQRVPWHKLNYRKEREYVKREDSYWMGIKNVGFSPYAAMNNPFGVSE